MKKDFEDEAISQSDPEVDGKSGPTDGEQELGGKQVGPEDKVNTKPNNNY